MSGPKTRAPGGPLLQVEDLSITLAGPRGGTRIVRNVDLRVDPGEAIGIAGESGSGKSLTAMSLLNLLPANARVTGSVTFDGDELVGMDRSGWQRIRGSQIAMVFQDSSSALHPMLPIGTQLTEHMRIALGLSKAAARRRALELLEQVRIPALDRVLKSYPHQFSGGMRQRIAIACALACRPRVLIADEPTTALDVTVQAGILQLLDELRREYNLAVIFITHDLGVLAALTQRLYVFYAGQVMESGATGLVLGRPDHPYTAALLAARPHGLSSRQTLQAIPGSPAIAGQDYTGCPFAPRCVHVQPRCGQPGILLESLGAGRRSACVVHPDLVQRPR